ncbi:MAG: hypothetical protein HT580_16710 [Dechloromonas sp.]|nr:MAG: hypothetical protein HT580_16710 [Dechloromonas sp.]
MLGDSDEQEPWMLEVGPQGQEQPQVKGTCEATPVNVSFIEYTRPCSKRTRVVDGAWESQAGKRSNKGTAIVKQFATFDEFADFRLKRSAKVMQMVGMFSADLDGATVRHRWAAEDGEITATKEYLTFRAEPGVVIIDTDVKGAHEVAGLWPEQPKTWPTLKPSSPTSKRPCPS